MSSSIRRQIKRVVILGHSGFIGSHLMKAFEAAGDVEVKGVSMPRVDLTTPSSRETLIETLDESTAVVVCAAVKRQFGDTLEVYHQNMTIVENFAAAVAARPVARVAFMSSAAVYGEETHNVSISETTPVNPTSFYGIAKFTGECLLKKAFAALDSPSLICFRPPLVYGPGDQGRTYGPAGFSAALHEGKPITLWGDGAELREFLYVQDLCQIIRHLTLSDYSGAVNLVSGQSYCFTDVLEILRGISPTDFIVNQRERSKQKVDNAFDATLLRSLLPADFVFTPLESGVRTTLDSIR
jgi:UDP-glucose 4-epimerase